MIPSNILLAQLLPLNELSVQPAMPVDAISDKLSNLIPGQRVLAEIQARLPNGAYRAAIGQHDVTLALNFSAKPGDALELQVVENNGKLALAVAGNNQAPPPPPQDSVATNLSKAGQLISALVSNATNKGNAFPTAALNKGQPLSNGPLLDASLLAPRLQQAVENSGLFYEAHLARWTFGENISEQQLRTEPQGQLSKQAIAGKLSPELAGTKKQLETALPQFVKPTLQPLLEKNESGIETPSQTFLPPQVPSPSLAGNAVSPIATELTPLVQQQLASLDNQTLQWQGQLTLGQNMYWEIIKEEGSQKPSEDESRPISWRTRLKLQLPELGDIEARLHIQGEQIGLLLEASDALTREKLQNAKDLLRQNLATTGLILTTLGIAPPPLHSTEGSNAA